MKNIILLSMFALLFLSGCDSTARYAVGCVNFNGDGRIKLSELARSTATKGQLVFTDMVAEGEITPRQQRAGDLMYLATNENIKLVFLQFGFKRSTICGYETIEGVQTKQVIMLLEHVKHELQENDILFTLPETRPAQE